MALTQVSTGGVKDDAVTAGKIPADAVGQSEIADEAVDEARLQISNAGSNGQFLSKQSGNTGGLTWADGASEGTEVKSTGESGTTKFLRTDGDGTCSWQVPPDNNTVYTHPNHSGEVTSSADGAQTIASDVVDEDNLKISNAGTNGQFLQKQSGNTGGLTWADATSAAMGYDVWCVDGDFPAGNSYYREWNYQQAWGSAQTFTNDGGSGAASGGPGPATMSISRCTTSQNPFFAKVGTGMSMSDGIFSFPNTGEWRVTFAPQAVEKNTSGGGHNLYIWTTSDNGSNWHDAIRTLNRSHDSMWAGVPFNVTALRFNITDTSNQKVKFSMGGGDGRTRVLGYSDRVGSHFMFEQIS